MNKYHDSVLREITDEIELMSVGGSGGGSGQWETGAAGVWAGVMDGLGYSCSLPGGFYGPGISVATGSGTCVGGNMGSSDPIWGN